MHSSLTLVQPIHGLNVESHQLMFVIFAILLIITLGSFVVPASAWSQQMGLFGLSEILMIPALLVCCALALQQELQQHHYRWMLGRPDRGNR